MKKLIRAVLTGYRKLVTRLKLFKGQKGQDKWVIFTVLPFKRKGYFLDLAATDGITNNNTYSLEKLFGWNGICIEPNPIFNQKLTKTRNCIIDNSVVNDKHESVEFRIDVGGWGGIIADDTDNNPRLRSEQLSNAETIRLDTVLLTEILDRYSAPRIIDYFSLDVEGSEERVLRNFDFNQYQFNCLTIERPTPELNEILFKNDYTFVKNNQFDSFYVHSSLAEQGKIRCQPFEQIPPKNY
ncbi:MAG: FkbM family methyltransferase [Anaerolineales bacterium]